MNEKTQQQRVFEDVYNGIIPERVPINATFPLEYAILYSGRDLGQTQWTLQGVAEAADELCSMIPSDVAPLGTPRYPAFLTILGSKTFSMGQNGFMQHPEISSMQPGDYDRFIKAPRDYIVSEIMPRLMNNFSDNPVESAIIFTQAYLANQEYQAKHAQIVASLRAKHDFYTPPAGSLGGGTVPFDYLADFIRGFTGIIQDVKKCPEKILEACEALLPYIVDKCVPVNPSPLGYTFIPLHMATYLREKEFERLYYPSFIKFVHVLKAHGQPAHLYCESDWMRYLDYLSEMPEGTRYTFEYGDAKKVKEKLGARHILSGLYPVTYLRTATKQQSVDKAKELVDIMAPGGNYLFAFDKNPFVLSDIKLENFIAVLDYVKNHTAYSNAGAASRTIEAETKYSAAIVAPFSSKYRHTDSDPDFYTRDLREDIKPIAREVIGKYENMVNAFLNKLL